MDSNFKRLSEADKAFVERQENELAKLPEELRSAVRFYAWEQGHSSGYDSVLEHLRQVVDMLEEPCKKLVANAKETHAKA